MGVKNRLKNFTRCCLQYSWYFAAELALAYTEEESALILSDRLREFFKKLGLKVSLEELSIGKEHFEEMAARATKGGTQTVGHYVPLDQKRIIDVLEIAIR